jgi:hypothetical protein
MSTDDYKGVYVGLITRPFIGLRRMGAPQVLLAAGVVYAGPVAKATGFVGQAVSPRKRCPQPTFVEEVEGILLAGNLPG